jgi:reactive intermediate/imine deaminase
MHKTIIHTNDAPAAIGTYSQAVQVGDTMYISGQIPLDPSTMDIVSGTIEQQIHRVFANLFAILQAASLNMDHIVKLNIYLTDMTHFPIVNEVMAHYFQEPYPARAAIGVAALPKGVAVEMDAIAVTE